MSEDSESNLSLERGSMLSVRLLTIDHYIAKPLEYLRSQYNESSTSSSLSVPVLRMFGPTSTGEKACVHIHGVLPYIYVPYEGGENPERDAILLAAGIERAIKASSDANDRYAANQRYVHRIRLVSGIPMYGYHSGPRQFFKIYLFNPYSVRKLAELLLKGAILNMKLQPHESHIPFTQQFMIDFNLFGMSLVKFSKVMYRRNPENPELQKDVPAEFLLPPSVSKTSHCMVEVDVLAEDILNRLEERDAAANPGLVGIWAEERARRTLNNQLSEPTPPSTQSRPYLEPFGMEIELLKDFEERLVVACQEVSEVPSTAVRTPYPATISDNSTLLDASTIDVDEADDEQQVPDQELINETLVQELTQRLAQLSESEDGESEDERERPGRGEGAASDEEGEVLDMTQPLSPPVGLAAAAVSDQTGDSSSDSEGDFWKQMAEEINQLDGAGDDSDQQTTTVVDDGWSQNLLAILDGDLSFQAPPSQVTYFDMPSLSAWCFSPCPETSVENSVTLVDESPVNLDVMSPVQLPDTPASSASPHTVSSDLEDIIQPDNFRKSPSAWDVVKEKILSGTGGANSLTLQQYVKGEVVNVCFKVINGTESVVIEYKPFLRGVPSSRTKFLVRPLCEFVQEWHLADQKGVSEPGTKSYPTYINGFTKNSTRAPVKRVTKSKKRCDKECQTAESMPSSERLNLYPNSSKSYSINESVISKKKITLKFVTSEQAAQIEAGDKEPPRQVPESSLPPPPPLGVTVSTDPVFSPQFPRVESPSVSSCNINNNDCPPLLTPKREPGIPDDHLLKAVNDKFEEYYRRLMGKKSSPSPVIKEEHEVICLSDSHSSDDGGYSTCSSRKVRQSKKKVLKRNSRKKSPMNPVDFVSQILNNYSNHPRNSYLPSMSITVNIGDPSAPVQVSVQPHRRGHLDGAEDSSSDESTSSKPARKKTKYRPLSVSVEPSPITEKCRNRATAPISKAASQMGDLSSSTKQSSRPGPSTRSQSAKLSDRGERTPRVTRSSVPALDVIVLSDGETVPQMDVTASSSDDAGPSKGPPMKRKEKIQRKDYATSTSEKAAMDVVPVEDIDDEVIPGSPVNRRTKRKQARSKKGSEEIKITDNEQHCAVLPNSSESSEIIHPNMPSKSPSETAPLPSQIEREVSASLVSDSGVGESSMHDIFQNYLSNEDLTCQSKYFDNTDVPIFVHSPSVLKTRCFTPKSPPPSRKIVSATIDECINLQTSGIEPFYSNFKDITKTMEIGNKLLRVDHQFAGLKVFQPSLGRSLGEIRKELLGPDSALPREAIMRSRSIVLTPLLKPPTRIEVMVNLKEESVLENEVCPKLKMLMPGGGDDSNSGDESMAMSPCTPSILSGGSPISFGDLSEPASPLPDATPKSFRKTPRRVSFDETVRSHSPSRSPASQSTPISRKRTSTLPAIAEELSALKRGPIDRVKGRRRLSLRDRRASTDSNKSNDIFEPEMKPENEKSVIQPFSSNPRDYSLNASVSGKNQSCQIQGVSLDNTFGFKTSLQNFQQAKPSQKHTTVLILEILTSTRGELRPDPQLDAILAVFYGLVQDYPNTPEPIFGVFTVGPALNGTGISNFGTHIVADEKVLLNELIASIRKWDPDIVAGYEIEQGSWGYVLQRGSVVGINMLSQLGRTVAYPREERSDETKESADDVPRHIRQLRLPGRVVLNVWRLLRHELALTSYTWENIMFHLLHERHHQMPFHMLSHLWQHRTPRARAIPANYMLTRVKGVARILTQLDLISRTSELARLFGIQFEEVLSRGSQFRVESMMLRLAKPKNLVPVSPSIEQRARMRAPCSLPLIMEPESKYYADPVIVLDFQSLYPSMIIAYNYCFSTCLGRVSLLGMSEEPFEFGCTRLSVPPADLAALKGEIHISPVGVGFVRPNVRRGILPSMLEEILDTRLMVKKSMKENKSDKLLQKVLHARQLGLKLIANVTYGYTAANFSGRMPCIEIGDSVVSKGRETLQRAIRLVQSTSRWGARVVYGDTDSLFVMTPGRTREEAFQIGQEIADAVTLDNPRPVKLKLEKVYQPCILQTKKRYVGYMYESPQQKEPVYEAKGIETVRRDGCPATAKILQKALQILFDTGDVSLVKKYTLQQFGKLFQGRINLQDLIFAKEYRGRDGYRPGACVPALQLAKRWTAVDRRAEPRRKERVPYVIVHGAPGVPLIRLVRSPRELLADQSLRVHAAYYITKAIIPPMQRCFTLLGADPLTWYAEMPRRFHRMVRSGVSGEPVRRTTISQYFVSLECAACGRLSQDRVCSACTANPAALVTLLNSKARNWDRAVERVTKTCRSCCGRPDYIDCISLDCPTLYRRKQVQEDSRQADSLRDLICS